MLRTLVLLCFSFTLIFMCVVSFVGSPDIEDIEELEGDELL